MAALSTITVSAVGTESATLTLNASAFDLSSNQITDLAKVLNKLSAQCTGAGGTRHGASTVVTLPAGF